MNTEIIVVLTDKPPIEDEIKLLNVFIANMPNSMKKHEMLRAVRNIHKEINDLRETKLRRFNNDECWIYQGDGSDNLQSLVCPVVIDPGQLRELESMKTWKKLAERHAQRIKSMALTIMMCAKKHSDLAEIKEVEEVLTMVNGIQPECKEATNEQ